MKTEFEIIQPDAGSSFRLLHHKVSADAFKWHYHYHPEYEIVCVFEGTGRRHVGNHLSNYTDGDLVLIGSNLPHAGFGYGAIGTHEEVVIQFTEDFLGKDFFAKPEMELIKKLFLRAKQGLCFQGETRTKIAEKFRQIPTLSHFERLVELLNILQGLANSKEFILLNPVDFHYNFSHKDQERLSKVYKFVEENYTQEIDIKEVADMCNLTVPAFCNYFKKNVNQTFTDFTNEFRINQACKMLLDGDEIMDICYKCGFNNVSYFGRVFKQIKGKNPSQFRRLFAKT
ncbi:MAG: AraC family transcriptional regulator [Arcicella sp.]|jgi:AraC-like DNA-binding protein/quercetin dioxygenase-like cupin family protein|nr:AraC family transcriptional regulator [Arcicella sp.]